MRDERLTDEAAANLLGEEWLRDLGVRWQEEQGRNAAADLELLHMARAVAKYARREERRARIVRVSKMVGCIALGVALAVAAMGAASWIADALRGVTR